MNANQVDLFGKFVDMAKANGPFFFSVLMIGLSIWALNRLVSQKRSGKVVLVHEKALLAFCFITLVGGLIVAWQASSWWFSSQNVPFGRYATILRIPDDINVWSDAAELYQKRIDSKESPSHSVKLAILSKIPCDSSGQLVIQLHRAGMKQPDNFPIECALLDSNWPDKTSFNFDVDGRSGNLVLTSSTRLASHDSQTLIPSAHADEVDRILSTTQRNYAPLTRIEDANQLAKTLQNAQAKPGEKVDALNQLINTPSLANNMTKAALNAGLPEPLYATLLDLQRHSDKQLATKARLLISKLPLTKDLTTLAQSPASTDISMLKSITASTSTEDRGRLANTPQLIALIKSSGASPSDSPPIPTYTKDGDRFFIQASWDNKDESTVQCIGKAYFDIWGGDSLAQQTELARAKSSRTVYYTKAWSTRMYDRLIQCHAKVAYVTGYQP